MDHDGRWWVIELKRDGVTLATIEQVLRYKRELDARHRDTTHHPVIAGLRCSPETRAAARAAGVAVHVFDKTVIQALMVKFEVTDRRRRRNGSNGTPSAPPRGPPWRVVVTTSRPGTRCSPNSTTPSRQVL